MDETVPQLTSRVMRIVPSHTLPVSLYSFLDKYVVSGSISGSAKAEFQLQIAVPPVCSTMTFTMQHSHTPAVLNSTVNSVSFHSGISERTV